MKRLILFLSLCLTLISTQAQQLIWERTIGNAMADTAAMEYVRAPDGGFAAVFREDVYGVSISRYDSLGNEIWNTPLPTGSGLRMAELMHSMLKAVPGGLIAGMQQYPAGADTAKVALVKLSWQGTILWTKTISTGRNYNTACDMHIRSANEYIVLATGANNDQILGDGGGFKHVAISIDSTGTTNWRRIYLDPLLTIDQPVNVVPYSPNGYIFGGHTGSNGALVRLIKTDAVGNVLQNGLLTDSEAPDGYVTIAGNFIPTSDGNIVFTGFHNSNSWSDSYILVTKIDTALNKLWTITHTEPGGNFSSSKVLELANGNILLVTQQHLNNKIILLTISPQGQPLDTTYITVTNTTHSPGVRNCFLLPDGSLIYGGLIFMAKIGNVGIPTTFTSSPEQVKLPPLLGLAFPNPAENTVTVPYTIPEGTSTATLRIAEVATGRLVREVPLNLQAEHVQLNLDRFSSGLYTYTLLLDGVPNATKKLVIIK